MKFGGLVAVSELSFKIGPGAICAIIGPNGAGKSSLFNAITGFVPIASGTIELNGASIAGLLPHQVAARGISRTFQHNGLVRDMTVLENVILGLELKTSSSLLGVVLGTSPSVNAEVSAVRQARDMLKRMQIEDLADRTAGELPFGQQRLVELCRVLVSGATLLLLDEPAVGLSEKERRSLVTVLKQIAEKEVGILLIEHVLDVVRAVADRALVMNHGKKLVECSPNDLASHQSVLDAYLGHV